MPSQLPFFQLFIKYIPAVQRDSHALYFNKTLLEVANKLMIYSWEEKQAHTHTLSNWK